jgi:polyisoprenoid-binding protein YceI
MRGVSKQVTLPMEFLGFGKDPWGNDRAGFAIETTLNRKDFGILGTRRSTRAATSWGTT